MVNRRSLNR